MLRCLAVSAGIAAVLSAGAARADTPLTASSGPAVTLQYKYHTGQVEHYQMVMDMATHSPSGGAGFEIPPIHSDSTMRMTVQDVRASDGAATVQSKIDSYKMTMNGQPMPMGQGQPDMTQMTTTTVLSPSGKVISAQADDTASPQATAALSGMQTTAAFPSGPVHVGDVWTTTASIPGLGHDLQIRSRLVGVDQSSGDSVAKINQYFSNSSTVPVPGGSGQMNTHMTGDGTLSFDIDRGVLLGDSMTMHVAIASPTPSVPAMAMDMTMKFSRITSGSDALAPPAPNPGAPTPALAPAPAAPQSGLTPGNAGSGGNTSMPPAAPPPVAKQP